ncbi:AbrB/MazE/SpoVT family DNA-binding domain-containing protein [Thermococcus argininiproducens]|uniref:AbrB/MazE/SpoVT family DNA-binding domain-containing protein n=1 Tax=Thermococcus argininiproducens TaxID=2866384 RepID=A0A9E7MA51_9EURY|nr:AbrB/MazE/SpoVT family DNA-binding domain-containing protein [Thermococcus argininiproducens]USG99838.1 AbrB/MazE/SpoVT family DNA-binding domain-containing protein [Thermococcus argininiproducens]
MTTKNTESQVIEPLAKFHAEVDKYGRFTLPKITRKRYSIEQSDFVELIVRIIRDNVVLSRVHVFVRVAKDGKIYLPQKIVKKFNIIQDDILEVLLIRYFKIDDLLTEEARNIKHLLKNKYEILTATQEAEILSTNVQITSSTKREN